MAFDAFIKIDGIEGESTDYKHKGWIEISFFGCGLSQKVSRTASSAGDASVERADFQEFVFTKLIDKATPLLALACADGTHIDKIAVELCRAGTDKVKFMEFVLKDCFISGASILAGKSKERTDDFPVETICINYGKIQWVYTQQSRAGGGASGNIATGWDLEKNNAM